MPSRVVVMWRIAWTVVSLIVVQVTVCAMSAVPVVVVWHTMLRLTASDPFLRVVLISVALVPSYLPSV